MSTISDRTLTAIVRELADYEGEDLDRDEIADIVDDAHGSRWSTRIDTPFGEWLITDDGYELAVKYVEELLETDPESFDQDWLRGHMTMSPTDIRIYAADYADSVAEDMDENDLDGEDREDWAAAYAEEIAAELRRDALGWFEDQFGKGQYPKNLLTLDVREAAVDAVDAEGPAAFLAGYDSEEVTITVNGKTFDCYRTN